MVAFPEDASLLTPSEVAALLRIKLSTVYAASASGRRPAVRLWRGRRKSLLRFKRSEIERLIAGGVNAST
jgi:excisionase family DNA binding protein